MFLHACLDEWTKVLVLNSTLPSYFMEACSVGPDAHGLILQVAFASLITDWAVEGMIGEGEFHHSLTIFRSTIDVLG